MRWKKLGKIFDPSQHKWTQDFIGYAQSPQALEFENFVRIYFSIRKKDEQEKFISHIQFVDFDKDLKSIINVSDHEVFGPGKLGCFDEHGIFPINVLRNKDKILAYTNGWTRRVSVSVDTGIGLAISLDNGNTFERVGDGPVLSSTVHEPVLVGDPFVKIIDGIFHMWYIFGLGWKKYSAKTPPDRIYKISHATSKDGVNWKKGDGKQIIVDRLNKDECQALPTVSYFRDRYHMFFCYRSAVDFRNNKDNAYRIGYAYSYDLRNWTRDDSQAGIDVSENGWDSEMQCYPHIFEMNEKMYLLYNGNGFGANGFGAAILEYH
ncbi:MAG: hypothetical protein RIB47_11560 [Cyclobacteriaceae bacterium]